MKIAFNVGSLALFGARTQSSQRSHALSTQVEIVQSFHDFEHLSVHLNELLHLASSNLNFISFYLLDCSHEECGIKSIHNCEKVTLVM